MTYTRETAIGSEQASRILASLGQSEDFHAGSDYYIASDAKGGEFLTEWGQDEPIAENTTTTSWLTA